MNLFLTGGSGFLGSAVIARIALAKQYDKIYVLMRGNRKQTPQERLEALANKIFAPAQAVEALKRMVVVPGDLTEPGLGIPADLRKEMTQSLHQILHVGASTDFGAPLGESRMYNVEGTKKVIDLAEECCASGNFRRFDYVSTAFVAGTKSGVVTETDLDRDQNFANNYERTKFEAEVMMRGYMHKFPVVVHRPSIVVGDSRNGYTPHFKVLYWPLRLLSKNILPFIPCDPKATLDVVPIDFVADSIVAIMQSDEALQQTFHITAGRGREVRIGAFLKDAYRFTNIQRRPIIPFWVFNLIRYTPVRNFFSEDMWHAVEIAATYDDYLKGTGVTFDCTRTLQLLQKLGVKQPNWPDYKAKVLKYCIDSRWGRKPPQLEYMYYANS